MKLTKHAWILWGIALVVIIILMAIIPFIRTTAWWVGAIGCVLMFGVCAFAFFRAFVFEKKESKVLGWPIFKVGYTALIVQLVVGGIIMGIAAYCPVWTAVIAEVMVFAVTSICLTVRDAAREVVTWSEVKAENKTVAWKEIRAKAVGMPENVREALRYADPIPTSIDGEIVAAIEANDAEQVQELLNKRRSLAKVEK